MSAYKKIECFLASKTTLLQALSDLGLDAQVHTEPVAMAGGYGHESRQLKAEIVVSRDSLTKSFGQASNSLGFSWNENAKSYDIICYEYDVHSGIHNRVKQAYATAAIVEALGGQRFSVKSVTGNMKQKARTKVSIMASKVI